MNNINNKTRIRNKINIWQTEIAPTLNQINDVDYQISTLDKRIARLNDQKTELLSQKENIGTILKRPKIRTL